MYNAKYTTEYPGVAQLVARLLWEQDAASSSLATWTISSCVIGFQYPIAQLDFLFFKDYAESVCVGSYVTVTPLRVSTDICGSGIETSFGISMAPMQL